GVGRLPVADRAGQVRGVRGDAVPAEPDAAGAAIGPVRGRPTRDVSRPMRRLAAANIALHLIGLACAAVWMRPGTPAAPLAVRMAYLAGRPGGWALSWSVWIGCIFLMVAFTAAAARRLPDSPLARLAVVVAVAAGSFDLLGDSTYIIVFPQVAGLQPTNMQLF